MEGEDKLGIQYAIYDFAEEVLGVRYYTPYFDYIPVWKEIVVSPINKLETPEFPLRRLIIFSWVDLNCWDIKKDRPAKWVKKTDDFTRETQEGKFWLYNALVGDTTMMKRAVDWTVKNKQNMILWGHEVFQHFPPRLPLDYTQYEAMRGIKIQGFLSPGSSHIPGGKPADHVTKNWCRSGDGTSPPAPHQCYGTQAYWDMLEREIQWYIRPENRIRQVANFIIYYGEGPCGYPAYCLNDRSRKKCFRCGHIPNWKKWTRTMAVAEKRLRELGFNVPVGLLTSGGGCASSGNPPVDDRRFGVSPEWDIKKIQNTPSKNNFWQLRGSGDSTFEERGHNWPMVKEENKRTGKKLTIFREGESAVMMQTDTPLMSPYYFYTRDHDFHALPGTA